MAQTSNLIGGQWWPLGYPYYMQQKRASAGTIAAGVRIYQGALAIAVDGVARPATSGSTLRGLGLLVAGADANGGSYYRASRAGVTVQHISGAAEKITITEGATCLVAITYNNGTSTAATLAQLVLQHAEARRLLPGVIAQGTGASSPAAAAAAAVPFIEMLGESPIEIDNSAGGSPADLPAEALFNFGGAYGMSPAASNAPVVDGQAYVVDDDTITKVASTFDLHGPCVGKSDDSTFYFLDLQGVE